MSQMSRNLSPPRAEPVKRGLPTFSSLLSTVIWVKNCRSKKGVKQCLGGLKCSQNTKENKKTLKVSFKAIFNVHFANLVSKEYFSTVPMSHRFMTSHPVTELLLCFRAKHKDGRSMLFGFLVIFTHRLTELCILNAENIKKVYSRPFKQMS